MLTIKFAVGVNGEDDEYEIEPTSSQLIEGELIFDNSTQIITSFDFTWKRLYLAFFKIIFLFIINLV